MFTAVFCSRVLFEIAERLGIANYSMADAIEFVRKNFLGNRDVDFMGKRFLCYTVSSILIVIGLAATIARGRNILDIDFNGGTSVIFSITKPMEPDEVRKVIGQVFDKDENDLPIQTSLTEVRLNDFEPRRSISWIARSRQSMTLPIDSCKDSLPIKRRPAW